MTGLGVVYATCPACGHQTGTQKASGVKIRCSRCYPERGKDVFITVPERNENTTRKVITATRPKKVTTTARPAKVTTAAVTAGPEPEPIKKRIREALGTGGPQHPHPASRGSWVARGVCEVICNDCGLRAWRARLTPEAQARAGYRSPVVLLEPRRADGGTGGVVVGGDGLAAFSGRYPGQYAKHNCPARVVRCKFCGEPVRVLNQPDGRLAVLDADENPGGIVAVDSRGYAVRDPDRRVRGPRYLWHDMHVPAGDRGAETDFGRLITQRPTGSGR